MNLLRKCAAAVIASAMLLSFAACSSDTGWIMRKGELEMPAGVYLNNLMQSYYEASMMVENPDKSVLKQQIEDKDASEWIKEEALKNTKQSMAICDLFNELKLSFTEEELMTCHTQAENYYEKAGKNLEENGISQNSVELLYQISYMKAKVFDALYGEGGEKEIDEAEVQKYYDDNYIKMAVQTFNLPQKQEVAEDASEDEKKAAQELYEMQLTPIVSQAEELRLEGEIGADSGKEWNTILNEYKKRNQPGDAKPEDYDMTTDNYRLLDTATTPLDKTIVDALKEAEQGKVISVRTDSLIAVGATTDIHEDPTDYEFVKNSIVHVLKEEEFENYLLEKASDEAFVVNEKSVERYTPKKLVIE